MSRELAAQLNLDLAWRRIKFDRPDRCFASHPYLIDLVELDLPDWLGRLNQRIIEGYAPTANLVLNVPKPNWQVRPGAYLRLDDETVFTALVGSVFADISASLRWSQGDPDIAYQLANQADAVEWLLRNFVVWKQWREKSAERLRGGTEFVLAADISAFYENIDLGRLASDLRTIGIPAETEQLLSACLNRWAQPRGKGIPQGYSAGDILAKVYLEPVDRALRNEGYDHLRYVDDIRIFCRDVRQAKKALLRLTELLRNRGLNIQTAKTQILRADQALREIDGVAPVVQAIQVELQHELRAAFGQGPYATVADLERIVAAHPERPPIEVLERAFQAHFIDASGTPFDKTLFHFLLTRLATVSSEIARNYCIELLGRKPEETEYCLRYFAKVGLEDPDRERVIAFLSSPEAIYEYQVFQILRHFLEHSVFPDALLQYCRRIIRDGSFGSWVRTYTIAILGSGGRPADLEQLEALYPECADALQRSGVICSSRRMEHGRRNAFLGRVRDDGWLEQRAVRWVRARD
jgi:hypothetical protein